MSSDKPVDLGPELTRLLPEGVVDAWTLVAPLIPPSTYLGGGTGLAAHLLHRRSEDLDFFFHGEVELEALCDKLRNAGPLEVHLLDAGTLNGVFATVRIQFLDAADQAVLEPPQMLAGIPVASVADIMAMKLNAVSGRPELRDYFDLLAIEESGGPSLEEGLGLFMRRYEAAPDKLLPIVRALGYLDDVEEDRSLPLSKDKIASFWRRRQPELVKSLSRFE